MNRVKKQTALYVRRKCHLIFWKYTQVRAKKGHHLKTRKDHLHPTLLQEPLPHLHVMLNLQMQLKTHALMILTDRQLIALYKQSSVKWACPVTCKLQGDVAVGEGVTRKFFSAIIQRLKAGFSINLGNIERTCLFEGEPDHLVPSSSQSLIEGDMFLVAGRMLGHSFLHGGPRLPGLSRSIDHDIREIIKLVDGDDELSEDECQAVLESFLGYTWPNQYKQKVAL
ncbi:uncharacterized protein LOC143481941 isoform X2 [Brachyhypopomus gauderio]|uniref:uncharacterized protein LOC143481941 isoform X2 n=1 Tax=Brachyhypopomus gauderio TaxID=698409 RepID=UPI004042D4ED